MANPYTFYCLCSVGYYVEPTIFETKDPKNKMMQEVCYQSNCAHIDFYVFGRRYLDLFLLCMSTNQLSGKELLIWYVESL